MTEAAKRAYVLSAAETDRVYRRAFRASRKRAHDGPDADDWRADGHTTGVCAACVRWASAAADLAEVLAPTFAKPDGGA